MKLSFETLRAISLGAVEVEKTEKGVSFYRFTKEQRELYKKRSTSFYNKSFSASGVKFRFRTDSTKLGISGTTASGSSRKYFSFDLFIDGEKKESYDNFSAITDNPANDGEYLRGPFEKEFDLGEGEKEVLLYCPWSAQVIFSEVTVSDGAFVEPVKPEKKMLVFGDSITQGYDAAYACNSYISRLARALNVEEYNKAIGGEVFWPELAATAEPFKPDLITVAYGTNDWSKSKSWEEFESNCKGFYENLSRNYSDVPIFAISPIWRKNYKMEKPCGDFHNVHKLFLEIEKEIPNMTVICGWEFVPQDSAYFRDAVLHPNDAGFAFYADALFDQLKKYL
ncbi:MAG: SGNH/GDSL hydrolase family protein [Ruminococcaceae bacterium]|nr:SGNH/GDSL hydrolase family protein [Oscillospiraceae bacterium]